MAMTQTFEFDFADRIRKARRVSGLSQQAMAEKLGVAQSRYSNWESGYAAPRGRDYVRVAKAISDATGAPLAWLLPELGDSVTGEYPSLDFATSPDPDDPAEPDESDDHQQAA